ncbi:MAG: hypothetical protein JOZ57_00630 [Abitibacteriaceae bacterium]|nr:hypothetical protein [Abditibacteriaceae bacterium]
MNHVELSRILALITSLAITFGLYDQTVKIWKTKSAKDISFSLVAALTLNELAWLYYGLMINEWPIILLSLLNLPAALIGAVGYWRYRH